MLVPCSPGTYHHANTNDADCRVDPGGRCPAGLADDSTRRPGEEAGTGCEAREIHVVKNDEKEVMKSPNIPTVRRRASSGADLPRVLLPKLLGGERDPVWHGSNRGACGCSGPVPRGQRVTAVVRLQ